eukprot:3741228-Amphidinium_carterae.1
MLLSHRVGGAAISLNSSVGASFVRRSARQADISTGTLAESSITWKVSPKDVLKALLVTQCDVFIHDFVLFLCPHHLGLSILAFITVLVSASVSSPESIQNRNRPGHGGVGETTKLESVVAA